MSKANERWSEDGLKEGTSVCTSSGPKISDDEWTEEARKARKWNTLGTVVDFSDSHGLCYKVRHRDGTEGYYDPKELEEIQGQAQPQHPPRGLTIDTRTGRRRS